MTNLLRQLQQQLSAQGFKGEFHLDLPMRVLNATDNSIYEVMPQAVVQPFNQDDLRLFMRLANQQPFTSLKFTARGGGTGTNGQALTSQIVIDFSRFMTRILEFDAASATVTVEPGLILTDLNRYLQPHGLFFAPHVSTADRATIGGMIATDAAGKGSLIYGKTSDHLLGLKCILADASEIDTISSECETRQQQLVDELVRLLAPLQREIKARFPRLKRSLSGYNLKQAYQDSQLNLDYLLAGAEGTLGLIYSAKLKLLPLPKVKALVVIHYSSFDAALRDANFLIEFAPLAIEAVDEKVQASAQSLPNWPELAQLLQNRGHSYISNFVEFTAATNAELEAKLTSLTSALTARQSKFVLIRDPEQINQLWLIRTLAVGLAGKLPGQAKPVAFVEDAIVPPEHLADFVADLQSELATRQLNYALYGHVDVGCIHVRPALNLQAAADRSQIRPLTEVVIKLLDKYHGILWGEHGKGYRGEFVPQVFGPILYPVLCQIKALFDPHNRFNPGKLAVPSANYQLQLIDQVTLRGELDQVINSSLQHYFAEAMLCNGNGACFNREPSNVMCPSYKITGDRIHSPKGRAMLVKQWLRARAQSPAQQVRAAQQALAALNGCLGCKGCVGKCPTQVSIPDLRTKFLASYYKLYAKPDVRTRLLANLESLIPYLAKLAPIWNFCQHYRLGPSFGLSSLPLFKSEQNLAKISKYLPFSWYHATSQISQLTRERAVVIFCDVFTSYFDAQVIVASVNLLRKLGFKPYLTLPQVSGKALVVAGFVNKFAQASASLAQVLDPLLAAGIPVVALENTLTSLFRDEYPKFGQSLVGGVASLAEFLAGVNHAWPQLDNHQHFCLLPHCTEQAVLPSEAKHWQSIFKRCGLSLEVKNLGCCGMAGSYGYLAEYQANSRALFELNWQTSLSTHAKIFLASGFSCRAQVARLSKVPVVHPIQILNQLL